jgi:hypothetical protein
VEIGIARPSTGEDVDLDRDRLASPDAALACRSARSVTIVRG